MSLVFPSNMHSHTVYSDGKNTVEEMVRAALDRGFVSLGLTDHGYAAYDAGYTIALEAVPQYRSDIEAMKRKYAGRIELYAGLEVDYYTYRDNDKSEWDIVVGGVHFVRSESGRYFSLDWTEQELEEAIDDIGGGDVRVLLQRYVDNLTDMATVYRPDILAHIDLFNKLNVDGCYFDVNAGWYREMWARAIDTIAASGCVVEVNTGAIARGHDVMYPHPMILEQLLARRVPLTLSSDSHAAETIDGCFDEALERIRAAGYHTLKMMRGGRFVDVEIG